MKIVTIVGARPQFVQLRITGRFTERRPWY